MNAKQKIITLLNDYPKTIWIISMSVLTTSIVALYFFLHYEIKGKEIVSLKQQQLNTINSFITQEPDTVRAKELIIDYVNAILPNTTMNVRVIANTYNLDQLIIILPSYPFEVRSYFWLSGTLVLLEVVFWSLFGLIAGLMFGVTQAREFKPEIVYEHIGKFFYTPFVCLVIYLSLNALMNSGSIAIADVEKSVIVLSFILGFFTRRSIMLLVKIKDLILPKGKEEEELDKSLRRKTCDDIKGTVEIVDDSVPDQEKGYFFENTEVSLTSADSGVATIKHPDNSGAYCFKKVKYGKYTISAKTVYNGQNYSKSTELNLNDKTGPLDVHIKLDKEDNNQQPTTGNAENPKTE